MKILIILLVLLAAWSVWGFFSSRVEQARYVVLREADGYEVREYQARIVAEATVEGDYRSGLNEGFRKVANYIFGGNNKREGVAMTAPVIATPVVGSSKPSWTISFGMPSSYRLDTLPTPNDNQVKISEIPKKTFAVKSFSWFAYESRVMAKKTELVEELKRDGVALLEVEPSYAGYNAPGTPPWMSHHEVLIEIKQAAK